MTVTLGKVFDLATCWQQIIPPMQSVQSEIRQLIHAIWSWSALFAIQPVHILQFSVAMINGLAQNVRWTSPFTIISMVRINFSTKWWVSSFMYYYICMSEHEKRPGTIYL
jgi:hypothetical protein